MSTEVITGDYDHDGDLGRKVKVGSFQSLGLEKNLLAGLSRMGYKVPTPVQRKALPIVLSGLDVVCMARTGSGKTCVFLLPLVQKLKTHNSTAGVRAVVLSPTRELAVQTLKFAKDMAKFTDLRIISIVGGDGIESQFEALSDRPDAIVATPGRLMHMLQEINTFKLRGVQYLVFDEADRLFEMGFAEQLTEIVKQCPEERQTLLFSATMPKMLLQFSRAGLRDPQLVRLDTDVKMSEELRLAFFTVRSNEKLAALLYLVRVIIPSDQQTIIFTATRHHSEFLFELLKRIGVSSTVVYGSMDQDARNFNLRQFRNGEVSYMIVTDLAARGIDVPLLNNVINFHFPPSPKMFVHRCGRAARQGRIGFAFSLVDPEELPYMVDVHRFLGMEVQAESPAEGSYTLQTMTPKMVHVGLLPQDVIDEENDFVKRALKDEEVLAVTWTVSENGFKQYRRTRPEASRDGVKGMKRLVKDKSIKHIHPLIVGCDPSKCNALVVEKANFIRLLQTFRPAQTVLETGIGSGTGSANIKNISKVGSKENQGMEAMKLLRKQNVNHLERNRVKLSVYGTDAGDAHAGHDDEDGSEGSTGEKLDDLEADGFDMNDEFDGNAAEGGGDGDSSSDEGGDTGGHLAAMFGHRANSHSAPSLGVSSSLSSSVEKPRLSIAERRKLKKKGLSNDEISKIAQQKVLEGANYTSLDDSVSKGDFKDKRFFMSYGNEDVGANFAEDSLQPRSGLRSSEAMNAARLDEALLDLTGGSTEGLDVSSKKKIMHWDEKKRKFVKQTLQEMAASNKKGLKRMRTESGVTMSTTSKQKKGEMYEKWKKKSKRDVGGLSTEDDDGRPRPKVRYNTKVKSELKSGDEIRKGNKLKEKNRIKNMAKDKRRKVVKKMKANKSGGSRKF